MSFDQTLYIENITIKYIYNTIITNPIFIVKIETFVKTLQNRELTPFDIPNLVLLIMDMIDDNTSSRYLSITTLPVLLKLIYEYIVDKYNLLPIEDKPIFESMFLASVNLAMRIPFEKKESRCLKIFKCC